jgi:hypothetical protein
MTLHDYDEIDWLEPWSRIGKDERGLVAELKRELGPWHPLFGLHAIPVARRYDDDVVLFALPTYQQPLAVVHLTWSGRREADARWPATEFFASLEEWVERGMKPDHQEYEGET